MCSCVFHKQYAWLVQLYSFFFHEYGEDSVLERKAIIMGQGEGNEG